MKKLVYLLLLSTLFLSMIPVIPYANPMSTTYVDDEASNEEIVAYTNYGSYSIYGYITVKYTIRLLILDDHGSIVLNNEYDLDIDISHENSGIDLDANDTGVLIAYKTITNDNIGLLWVNYDGTYSDLGVVEDTPTIEVNPIVKHGGDKWLVAYMDNSTYNLHMVLYDRFLSEIYSDSIYIGKNGGVDYRERAFYDENIPAFYIVYLNETLRDLWVVKIDPVSLSTRYVPITTDGTAGVEAYPYHGKLFRMYYGQILTSHDELLIIYGHSGGSTELDATLFDLVSLNTMRTIVLSPGMGDRSIRPWITSNNDDEWFVTWNYEGRIYSAVISSDGLSYDIYSIASDYYGYVVCSYNGHDYTVIYGNKTSGQYDLYAIRMRSGGYRSRAPLLVSNGVTDDIYGYPLASGDYQYIFFFNDTTTPTEKSWITIIETSDEIYPPTYIPLSILLDLTRIRDLMLDLSTLEIDGTMEYMVYGSPVPYKPIKGYLYRYIQYDSMIKGSREMLVSEVNNKTDEHGNFTLVFQTNGLKSGVYYVKVVYEGDDLLLPSSNTTPLFTMIFPTTEPTWASIPPELSVGPTMFYKNGQVIITDPIDEVGTNNRLGLSMTDLIGSEVGDVDIKTLYMGIDGEYLYIKAGFSGLVTESGDYAPVFTMAIDFTPENLYDGVSSESMVIEDMGSTDTYYLYGNKWDWIIIATPKDPAGYISGDGTRYSLYMYIAYLDHGSWYYIGVVDGYFTVDGSTMNIHAPLGLVYMYNPRLMEDDIDSWKIYPAIYCVKLSSGYLVGNMGSNWFDVPGIITTNSTPPVYLDIGVYEDPLNDPIGTGPMYELDTGFIVNINWHTYRFFGKTKLSFIETRLDIPDHGHVVYDDPIIFLGTTEYLVRLTDLDNPYYGVYGKEIILYVDGSPTTVTGTTGVREDEVGYASLSYTSPSILMTRRTLTFRFLGDADYLGSEVSHEVGMRCLARISSTDLSLINNDHIPTVSPGDIIRIHLTVEVWNDKWVPAPTGLSFKVYLNSTPYYLGDAVIYSPGEAILNYTVSGDEGLYDEGGETHTIIIYGGNYTELLDNTTVLEYPYSLGMIPMPEPPITPLLILAMLLMIILLRKKIFR